MSAPWLVFRPLARGYLAAFEAIVRAAIEKLPGAPADWALPYWDYNSKAVANPRALPEAFAKNVWPDGGDNPLFDKRRYGAVTAWRSSGHRTSIPRPR